MDPNVTLAAIADILRRNPSDRRIGEHCRHLRQWVEQGGFSPEWTRHRDATSRYLQWCSENTPEALFMQEFGGTWSHATYQVGHILTRFEHPIEELLENVTSEEAAAIGSAYAAAVAALDTDEETECLMELFDALNKVAPSGCYFGANEGDGSDFGFWQDDTEEEIL